MPFLSGYNKRKAIKYGTVFPSSNLTDFPKLFKITTDSDIASELSSNNGIAVTQADGTTTVPFGLYPTTDGNVGTIIMRAKFPTILTAASTGDVLGYLYYDHTQTTSENKSGVVSNNYAIFAPLEEDPSGSSPQMFDWVSGSNLGASGGSMTSGDLVAGKVANNLNFDGSDDGVTFGTPSITDITMSGWVNADVITNAYTGVFTKATVSNTQATLYIKSNGKLAMYTTGASYDGVGSHTLSSGTWYHLALAYDNSVGLIGYVNGASDGTGTPGGSITAVGTVGIGLDYGFPSGRYFDGLIDEFQVSTLVRSADWIAYSYQDDLNNSDTFTLGTQEVGADAYPYWAVALLTQRRKHRTQLAIL